jgi:hypothetical protein
MDLGLAGPDIGRVQKALLHDVIAQPKLNNREWLPACGPSRITPAYDATIAHVRDARKLTGRDEQHHRDERAEHDRH